MIANETTSFVYKNKIENGNGECVKETKPDGHQWVFNQWELQHLEVCSSYIS